MATETAKKLEVQRDDAIALVVHCGWANAKKWGNDRLTSKLVAVDQMKEVMPEEAMSDDIQKTFDDVVAAVEGEAEVEVVGGTDKEAGKKKKASGEKKQRTSTVLDAAFKVLEASGGPLITKDLVVKMEADGWVNTASGTPPTTRVYSGIHGDINRRGEESRFIFVKRGTFGLKGRDKAEPVVVKEEAKEETAEKSD